YNKLVYLSLDKYNESPEIQIEENDIILVKTGSSYGKAAIIKRLPWIATINPQLVVIKSKHINSYILAQTICLPTIQKQIETTIVGGTIPTLSQESISNFNLKVSSFVEQGKIASFLGTVDQKIEQLEKMVVLQEKYKKGMMQRIFNQEIRFKSSKGTSFPAWQQKKLGDIAMIITGNTPSTLDVENYGTDFLFVSPSDLGQTKTILHTEKRLSQQGLKLTRQICKNSILFTCIGSTIGKIGIAGDLLATNQQINAVRCFDNNSYLFVYYYLDYIAPYIKRLAGEQAVPIINKTEFSKTKISHPILEEQEKIAGFLSALDDKIEQSKAELEKAKNWKKGLMQRLFV
ncbi:MAG: restriction endonuclease subunit S, partial [Tannerellaceae bacterium]